MKLLAKILLGILLFFILSIAGIFIWVSCFFDLNSYKNTISRVIFEQSGYTVNFQGDLSFSIYPSLGLTVEEMIVLDKDHANNTLMDAKKIHLSLDMRALWHKQIQVTEILAKGVDLRIIYGGPQPLVASAQRSDVKMPAAGKGGEASTSNQANTGQSEDKLMQQLERAEIERVLVENSTIFLIDAVTQQTYTLSAVRLETAHIKLGSPIDLFVSTQFTMPNQAQMNVTLSTSLLVGSGLKNVQLNPFKLVLEQDIFDGHFELDRRLSPWQMNAVLKSDEFDFARFLKDPKQKVIMKRIETTANLSFDPQSLNLEKSLEGEVLLTAGELTFNGIDLVEKANQLDQLRRMFVNKKADFGALLSMGKKIAEPSGSNAKTTLLEKLKVKNVIKSAVIASDLEITGAGGNYLIFGKGTIGFDQAVNFQLSLGLPEQPDKNLPTIVIPFKITGTVSDPQVSLIEPALLKQIEVMMKARVTDEVQDQIKDRAKGFLKNMVK